MGNRCGVTHCVGIVSSQLTNWFTYASPRTFYPLAGKMMPWFATAAVVFCALGLYVAFFVAPTDAQQGEG
ncbi:MAG: heme ABC transporter permease, partial [Burkholderiaceae bacterium]|nr:heme ABC transporter permease [Burkholderiaceae bacterium]